MHPGAINMMDHEVIFDRVGRRIGFYPRECSISSTSVSDASASASASSASDSSRSPRLQLRRMTAEGDSPLHSPLTRTPLFTTCP